ncbi:hypothetical protein HU200_042275 [Digitaria exilis]|uniref:Uncharacterized protein n=1 Tax=Digitaria exilis TaxID=1010633 RepID=A0A835B2R2_9POAL|nr:hypothetical protein HU200_042275 [Digitaria exilis]
MGRRGPLVHVFKLNEQRMEWAKVRGELGGRALFIGTLVTTMVKTNVKWMQNKTFTPRLYDWPETIQVDLIDRERQIGFCIHIDMRHNVVAHVASAYGHVDIGG